MKAVYKFYWDCGRNGSLDGIFTDHKETVDQLIGKEVYFGEVLGKHSEIYGTLDSGDIELVTDNPEFVKLFDEHGLSTGFNPIDTILNEAEYKSKEGIFILEDGTEIKEIE